MQGQGETSLTLARNVSTERRLLRPAGCVKNTPEQIQRSHWFQWNFQIDLGWRFGQIFLSSPTTTTWSWLTVSQRGLTYIPFKLDNLTAKDIISSIKSQISRYGILDKWSQTTDVGLLLLYLLNSWLAMTCNTQQSVLTVHKQTGKQKELYRLSNACWWRRQIHTKRCLTTQTSSRRWTLSYTTISRSSVEDDAATTFKLLQPGQGSSKERHN